MEFLPFKTISSNVDTLNTGSYYDVSDWNVIYKNTVPDKYFGSSEQDVIEFSTYDIEGNMKTWGYVAPSPTYNVLTKSYKDVEQNSKSYSFKKYSSGFIISYQRTILQNLLNDFKNSGIDNGNHVISYNYLRNVGDKNHNLIVKKVSTSRREILLIPDFQRGTDELEKFIYDDLSAFVQKKFLIRNILEEISKELDNYEIFKNSSDVLQKNPEVSVLLKKFYGFKIDSEIVSFILDTYTGFIRQVYGNNGQLMQKSFDGILNYLKNWMYTYFSEIMTSGEIQLTFSGIIEKAVVFRLNDINSHVDYSSVEAKTIIKFLTNLFYNNFVKKIIEKITSEYSERFFGYFQNGLNFGNGQIFPITNYEGYIDENNVPTLIVKLPETTSKFISVREKCWLSNISAAPTIQKVVIDSPVVRKKYKISGPNFNVKINDYTTKPVNFQTYESLNTTNDINVKKEIHSYKKMNEFNVDFSKFSEFILFSSAELRIKVYLSKSSNLSRLASKQQLYITGSMTAANSAISSSYALDYTDVTSQISDIYNSFDGFESYLNSLPAASLSGSSLTEYLENAVQYDKENRDSLINNIPNFIVGDTDNEDYLKFVAMIGHQFDNLYLYFKKYPLLQTDEIEFPTEDVDFYSTSGSYMASFANILLDQFGWTPISNLDSHIEDSMYLTGSNGKTPDQNLKILWNRILKNLPIIYKTKGTEESIKLLANIYGIPKYLVNVKEYGGLQSSVSEDKSSCIFENKFYFTKYSGKNEYLSIPVETPTKAIEFKFRTDESKVFSNNSYVNLFKTNDNKFSLSLYKNIGEKFGNVMCRINGQEMEISSVPVFNGKIYNIRLNGSSIPELTGSNAPVKFELNLICAEDDRFLINRSASVAVSYPTASYFYSCSALLFGNYDSGNGFYGNIDKINVWNRELSYDAFVNHCKNFEAYGNYSSSTVYEDLKFRYSFEYPENLYTSSGTYYVQNSNKYYSTVSASLIGFENTETTTTNCVEVSSSAFPYQFDEIETRQNIQVDNLGPNKYKNSKINRISESVLSRLMPFERSVISNANVYDSNLVSVCLEPFKIRNDDIMNFLGNENLMNQIGDPSFLNSGSYSTLQKLRNEYNNSNLAEKVLYQEFFTLYKNYFNNSFFESARRLFPARAKIIDGILIEPSILERPKYCNKEVTGAVQKDLAGQYSNLYRVSGSNIEVLRGTIDSNISKNGNVTAKFAVNFDGNCVSDDGIRIRNSLFSLNGNHYGQNISGSFENYRIFRQNITKRIDADDSTLYASFVSYNIGISGSVTSSYSAPDLESYPKGHLSLKSRPFVRKIISQIQGNTFSSSIYSTSQQTIDTTVSREGIPDGSSPVERTSIERDINRNSLTGGS